MAYFVSEYTIHFDDTMAYGSHHFLTAFKLQCASRESFLFGERIFDQAGVKEALETVHLFTADAYARNLSPAKLGDRLAILLSLEEWGRVSARFCYRVLGQAGQSVCVGYQNLICADPVSHLPMPLPVPLQQALDAVREIEERETADTFRSRVLAGGSKLESLFTDEEREIARQFFSQRYPSPQIIGLKQRDKLNSDVCEDGFAAQATNEEVPEDSSVTPVSEAWVFAGQAAFDAELLCERVSTYRQIAPAASQELNQCVRIAAELIGGDPSALIGDSPEKCAACVRATPELSQVAIHLQNVLGACLRRAQGYQPTVLVGHSFGEIAALGYAGCFDLATGIRIVCLRVRAVDKYAPAGGGLMVVACNRSVAQAEAAFLALSHVVIAGRNHDSQTVMSGPLDQLAQLRAHLRGSGIDAIAIPSPAAFHHPQLRLAAAHWLGELRALKIGPPQLPVYSLIGRHTISATDEIAAVLAGQFLKPFDLQGGVADLLQGQTTRFVDCGSTGALARLITKAGPVGLDVCTQPRVERKPVAKDSTVTMRPAATADDAGQTKGHRQEPEATCTIAPRVGIVGMGCILPGGASSPTRLFDAIADQNLGIVDQRQFDPHWSEDFYAEKLMPDRSYSHLTGRIDDGDIVSPPGIDPDTFNQFSRTQRLLCIALSPCLQSLKGATRILCILGATADGFEDQDELSALRLAGMELSDPEVERLMRTSRSAWPTPHGAVQEVFDQMLRPGLEITLVDAACASSLYAVALGMHALETDRADAVIAGGLFCPGPGNSCLFSQFRGTTATGCRPFDAQADGVVFSEGAALVTLRRLNDAQQSGLPIMAVVRGAGLSSDGKSSSANVPQSRGQLLSLQRCYANYQIDPATIQAIEGHGTSTPVGDSTELETLRQFFVGRTQQPIVVHSLKGLLGHAGWAAGTASVIAACEYMRRGVFPAQAMHRAPSAALQKCEGTLQVAHTPTRLSQKLLRIAVDGFGFGGANAHLVLESYVGEDSTADFGSRAAECPSAEENELVFVASYYQTPTANTPNGSRFDRQQLKLSRKHIVLPELAEDMDLTQILAVIVAEELLSQLPSLAADYQRETSLVLAMQGKSERGIEATLRILTPRLRRRLAGSEHAQERIEMAYAAARPCGPYTLQCMMPNVAAGRAALLLNLNGPNFVVDAGAGSLESALSSAALLLSSGDLGGTKLAIVAAINSNSEVAPRSSEELTEPDFAAAFAVTTRRFAQSNGLTILSDVRTAMDRAGLGVSDQQAMVGHTSRKVEALFRTLETSACRKSELAAGSQVTKTNYPEPPKADRQLPPQQTTGKSLPAPTLLSRPPLSNGSRPASASGTECEIHIPVWVEKRRSHEAVATAESLQWRSLLVVVSPNYSRLPELLGILPQLSERFLVAVVGHQPPSVDPIVSSDVVYVELGDSVRGNVLLKPFLDFRPETVVVLDEVESWDRETELAKLATDNQLCEFLFLYSQAAIALLEQGELELWGLFLDAWNGEVHPISGAIAGFLKSVNREYVAARTGTICMCGSDLGSAFRFLRAEQGSRDGEPEVVCDGERRLVRRLRRATKMTNCAPQVELDENSVVVATGGAKGVTAVMLQAILDTHRCTVIAIGRSPLEEGPPGYAQAEFEQQYYRDLLDSNPHINALEMKRCFESARTRWEAYESIELLRAMGGRVEYLVADVTDADQIANCIEHVVSKYGKIDLLVHGAGVQKSKRLPDRTLADFRQTYFTKVAGLQNLVQSCQAQLGRVVSTHVLTSAYSIFGNDGQHDYGAANETLDRLCVLRDKFEHSQWSSLAWLAWEGIGMTRGSEYRALAKKRRLTGIDPSLGQRLFREVMAGTTGSAINVPLTSSEHVEYALRTIPAATSSTTRRVVEAKVSLANIDCLPFHRIRNTPTLPGAWILDLLIKQGMRLLCPSMQPTQVKVNNTQFLRFIRFANNQEPNVRVIAEEVVDGIDVWMIADILHPTGVVLSRDEVCAKAKLSFDTGGELLTTSIRSETERGKPGGMRDPYCNPSKEVALSGLFDCLTDIHIGARSRNAKFSTDSRCEVNSIPALLLDAAWRVGAMYAGSRTDDVFVPVSIDRMLLPLSTTTGSAESWEIRSTAPQLDNRDVRWDRTEVFAESGDLKLIVENARATRLV